MSQKGVNVSRAALRTAARRHNTPPPFAQIGQRPPRRRSSAHRTKKPWMPSLAAPIISCANTTAHCACTDALVIQYFCFCFLRVRGADRGWDWGRSRSWVGWWWVAYETDRLVEVKGGGGAELGGGGGTLGHSALCQALCYDHRAIC